MVPPSDSTSSTRSNSIERRSRQPTISVFERLTMSRSVTTSGNVTTNKARPVHSSASTVHVAKRPGEFACNMNLRLTNMIFTLRQHFI